MKQINFKGLDWYVLEENNEITKLLLKDVLDEERITKYCPDAWFRNGKEVRHSDNVRAPFNWNKSYIKTTVLLNFKRDLGLGSNSRLTLLTKEEVEALPDEVRKCNAWYWTKSNASDDNDSYAYAWLVYSNGYVSWNNVYYTNSVRPVLYLPSNLITSGDTGQMACNEELDIRKIGIDENGYVHTELGAFKGRNMDIAFANKINEIIEKISKGDQLGSKEVMEKIGTIFNETLEGLRLFVIFPIRLCYWCCKNILMIVGIIEE